MINTLAYKDYIGTVNFSAEDAVFFGKVIGITDSISFEGESVSDLTKDFHNAVDEYLLFCKQNNKKPQQQYKGCFNVRIGSDLHRKASLLAQSQHITLNHLVKRSLQDYVNRAKI